MLKTLKSNPFNFITIIIAIMFIVIACCAYGLGDKEMAIRSLIGGCFFCLFLWVLGWYLKSPETTETES